MVDIVEDHSSADRRRGSGPQRRRRPSLRPKLQLSRVEGLDGLRVIGALAVVVYHVMGSVLDANPPVAVIMPPMAFTFFVLSGFVIYRPFAAGHLNRQAVPKTSHFLANRAIRVLPLWWIAIAVYLAVEGTDRLQTATDWWATIGLVQFAVPDARYAVIGPAWALSVEWIFYLSVPFIASFIQGAHRAVAPRASALQAQLAALIPLLVACAVLPPLRPFVAIILGMLLAIASVRQTMTGATPQWLEILRSPATAFVTTAVAWAILLDYPYKSGLSVQWVEEDPLVVAIWIVVAIAWFAPVAFGPGEGIITRHLRSPWATRFGLLTFGIYLWHDLVLTRTVRVLGTDAHLAAVMYLTVAGGIAAAAVTFFTVERPLMALRERLQPAPRIAGPRRLAPAQPPRARPAPAQSPTNPPATNQPPGRGWITSIDGLRVIAALCVITFHVGAEMDIPARWAQALAALFIPIFATFFVVSGFVLYRPWAMAQARIALGDGQAPLGPPDGGAASFWLRRALRVYPVYWVVQASALAISGTGDLEGVGDWLQVITLFPLPDFNVIINHGLGVIVWTMVVELVFYAVLPPLGRGITALVQRGTRFVTAQVLSLGGLFVVFAYLGSTSARVLAVACCIVVGMAIAAVDAWQRTLRRWAPGVRYLSRHPIVALPITLVCWAVGTVVARDDDPDLLFRTHLAIHLAAMVIVSIVLFLPAVFGSPKGAYRRFLSSTPMRVLGPLTFGIYLWHYPLIRQTVQQVDLPLPALQVWTMIAAPLLALITYRLIEQPMELLRHRHLGRTAAPPSPPVSGLVSPASATSTSEPTEASR